MEKKGKNSFRLIIKTILMEEINSKIKFESLYVFTEKM